MPNEQKHIDDLFRDKLGDLEKSPPFRVWKNIESVLDKKGKKRRVIIIQNIAASIILLLTIGGIYFFSSNKINHRNYKTSEEKTGKESTILNTTSETDSEKKINIASKENSNTVVIDSSTLLVRKNIKKEKNSRYKNFKTPIKSIENITSVSTNKKSKTIDNSEENLIALKNRKIYLVTNPEKSNTTSIFQQNNTAKAISQDNILAMNNLHNTNTKDKKGKWGIGGQFSPTYAYRDLSGVESENFYNYPSSYSNSTNNNNTEKPIMAYSGGFNIQYETNNRITIQSGIHYSKMGQKITDATAYNSNSDTYGENTLLTFSNSLGDIKSGSSSSDYTNQDSEEILPEALTNNDRNFSNNEFEQNEVNVEQNLEYIEIPFILKYKLIDSRIAFHLLGGVSTNFLVGNKVYVKENGGKNQIGETAGIRNFNYSSIIGVGINYNFASNFSFSVEPAFKYYLNAVNTNNNTKFYPYSLGVYTGISYSF